MTDDYVLWLLIRKPGEPAQRGRGELEEAVVYARSEAAARRMVEARRGLEPEGTWLNDAQVRTVFPREVAILTDGAAINTHAPTSGVVLLRGCW